MFLLIQAMFHYGVMSVSVPCRGLTCFYDEHRNIKEDEFWFPSPVGVLHVSIGKTGRVEEITDVSVPCRGLTCFYGKNEKIYNCV